MSLVLPPLPERALLADLCREAAERERLQPHVIEKDFYLTRLLWALGQQLRDQLLLKGGTLLSKVDLGFLRMSEDADFVIPGQPSSRKLQNVQRMHRIRDALKAVAPSVGVTARFPGGELLEKGAHYVWLLDYPSEFGPQGLKLEVSIRPQLRPAREVRLRQLLVDPLLGDASAASCFALDADEARAEKVRAAFTREAIRDFYDLDQLLAAGADFKSKRFVALVDAKLAELGERPLADQGASFGVDAGRRRKLDQGAARDLPAVLRVGAPAFDLDKVLVRFDRLWSK